MNTTGEPSKAVRRIAYVAGITVGIIAVVGALAVAGGIITAVVMGLIWVGGHL